jgi:DNA-3-methyladenine glycosylase II
VARTPVTSRHLLASSAVCLHKPFHEGDESIEVRHLADLGERVNSVQEARLRLVDIARPGDCSLVEQGGADLALRLGPKPADDLGWVPVGAEYVGTQVGEKGTLFCGLDHIEFSQAEAHRHPWFGLKHGPNLKPRSSPFVPGPVEVPCPFHLEVTMDGDSAVGSHQQVLAPRAHVVDHLARQIDCREPWHPKVGAREFLAGQGTVEALGGDEHCVAFRHGSILRAPTYVGRVTLTVDSFSATVDHLITADHDLARLVDAFGTPVFWQRPAGFSSLVLFILEQQVSLASAAAAYRRLRSRLGQMTPERLLATTPEELRTDGVSRQKDRYLRELATAITSGKLDLSALSAMDDDNVRSQLTIIPGIGRWTADVYLLACLGRPDLWPVADRALQVATAEALTLPDVPSPSDLELVGERWRPHRSTAARLLWHGYLGRRGRVETPNELLGD